LTAFYIARGLCPACGRKGPLVNLGPVCPEHGPYAFVTEPMAAVPQEDWLALEGTPGWETVETAHMDPFKDIPEVMAGAATEAMDRLAMESGPQGSLAGFALLDRVRRAGLTLTWDVLDAFVKRANFETAKGADLDRLGQMIDTQETDSIGAISTSRSRWPGMPDDAYRMLLRCSMPVGRASGSFREIAQRRFLELAEATHGCFAGPVRTCDPGCYGCKRKDTDGRCRCTKERNPDGSGCAAYQG
jgi:hypothetical protein